MRAPLPPAEKLRVEHESHTRRRLRAEQEGRERDRARNKQRRGSKRRATLRREAARALPSPLPCTAQIEGAGPIDRASAIGMAAALRAASWITLGIAVGLGAAAAFLWFRSFPPGALPLATTVLAAAICTVPAAVWLFQVWRAARGAQKAKVYFEGDALLVGWKGGTMLSLPVGSINGAHAVLDDGAMLAAGAGPAKVRQAARGTAAGTVVVRRDDGATLRVITTWQWALALVAAIELKRDQGASQATGVRRRKADLEVRASAPAALPPPLNEAALATLDRDGRPLDEWKRALRATFADAGYRRAPPLPADELLRVIGDVRVAAERRIGAALALAMLADEDVRGRLRVASDGLETEALRVAVERASEDTLEEDALEEAVALDETSHAR